MKYTVVTTFNSVGYQQYGCKMIRTFLLTWPREVELRVYAENCVVSESAPNLQVFDLSQASPELVRFKQRWGQDPRALGQGPDPSRKDANKTFKWDAIRFCHKVYAVMAAAKKTTDWLIWLDADMICHTLMPVRMLERMLPRDRDLCYLGRGEKFSECGLYGMNLNSKMTHDFLERFQHYYDEPETGIFTLAEWHDSFVFDAVRKQFALKELDWTGHVVSGEGHPLINSEWGTYLDHLKGARKSTGKSWRRDIRVARPESYWQDLPP